MTTMMSFLVMRRARRRHRHTSERRHQDGRKSYKGDGSKVVQGAGYNTVNMEALIQSLVNSGNEDVIMAAIASGMGACVSVVL